MVAIDRAAEDVRVLCRSWAEDFLGWPPSTVNGNLVGDYTFRDWASGEVLIRRRMPGRRMSEAGGEGER